MLPNGRKMSDEDLVEKLHSAGIEMDRERLWELTEKHLSAEEISHKLLETEEEEESDWPWICLTVLWERWFPDRPSLETIDDWMQEGYEKFEEDEIEESREPFLKLNHRHPFIKNFTSPCPPRQRRLAQTIPVHVAAAKNIKSAAPEWESIIRETHQLAISLNF